MYGWASYTIWFRFSWDGWMVEVGWQQHIIIIIIRRKLLKRNCAQRWCWRAAVCRVEGRYFIHVVRDWRLPVPQFPCVRSKSHRSAYTAGTRAGTLLSPTLSLSRSPSYKPTLSWAEASSSSPVLSAAAYSLSLISAIDIDDVARFYATQKQRRRQWNFNQNFNNICTSCKWLLSQ